MFVSFQYELPLLRVLFVLLPLLPGLSEEMLGVHREAVHRRTDRGDILQRREGVRVSERFPERAGGPCEQGPLGPVRDWGSVCAECESMWGVARGVAQRWRSCLYWIWVGCVSVWCVSRVRSACDVGEKVLVDVQYYLGTDMATGKCQLIYRGVGWVCPALIRLGVRGVCFRNKYNIVCIHNVTIIGGGGGSTFALPNVQFALYPVLTFMLL